MAKPLPDKFTDDQLSIILSAASPLPAVDRDQFIDDVVEALDGLEIGDGAVSRICRDVQRRYLKPPDPGRTARGHYW